VLSLARFSAPATRRSPGCGSIIGPRVRAQPGGARRRAGSVNSVGFIAVFPLTFISSAFVPVASMPAGLRDFAEVNPFTIVVDAIRHLWLGAPAHNNVWGAVVWSFVIVAVFAPLAVARYRRAAGR